VAIPARFSVDPKTGIQILALMNRSLHKEPGLGVPVCGAPVAHPALHDVAVESVLHGRHQGEEAGGTGGTKKALGMAVRQQDLATTFLPWWPPLPRPTGAGRSRLAGTSSADAHWNGMSHCRFITACSFCTYAINAGRASRGFPWLRRAMALLACCESSSSSRLPVQALRWLRLRHEEPMPTGGVIWHSKGCRGNLAEYQGRWQFLM
jgi:hypothetical protein